MTNENKDQFRQPDHEHDHFLLTTVVGSYPKPKWLNRSKELYGDDDADFDEENWQEAKDDAARIITDEHERAGLDVVVDGEMRRTEMVEFFAHRIEGYEFNGPVKVWGHNYFDKPSVVSEVESTTSPGSSTSTSSVHGRRQRPTGQGPDHWPLHPRELVVQRGPTMTTTSSPSNSPTSSRGDRKLVDAGARYIQIDEPALATTPDDHAIVGEALEHIVADIPEEVRIGLHVCYGDYSRIYPEILEFPVDEFDLELANGDYEQLDVFKDPEFSKDLARSASATLTSPRSSPSSRSRRTSRRASRSSRRNSWSSRRTAA